MKVGGEVLKIIKTIETSEKNQYPNSCYHPDSSSKVDFYISKITKSAKKQKKGLLTPKIQGVNRGLLRGATRGN